MVLPSTVWMAASLARGTRRFICTARYAFHAPALALHHPCPLDQVMEGFAGIGIAGGLADAEADLARMVRGIERLHRFADAHQRNHAAGAFVVGDHHEFVAFGAR